MHSTASPLTLKMSANSHYHRGFRQRQRRVWNHFAQQNPTTRPSDPTTHDFHSPPGSGIPLRHDHHHHHHHQPQVNNVPNPNTLGPNPFKHHSTDCGPHRQVRGSDIHAHGPPPRYPPYGMPDDDDDDHHHHPSAPHLPDDNAAAPPASASGYGGDGNGKPGDKIHTKSVNDILASYRAAVPSRTYIIPRLASKYTLVPRLVASWLQRWWCSAVTHRWLNIWSRWRTTTTTTTVLLCGSSLALGSAALVKLVSAYFTRLSSSFLTITTECFAHQVTITSIRRTWSRRAQIGNWILSRIRILARGFVLWWLVCVVLNMWARWGGGDLVWWFALRKKPLFLGHISNILTVFHVGRGGGGDGGGHYYFYDALQASTNPDAVRGEMITAVATSVATAATSGNITHGTTMNPSVFLSATLSGLETCYSWLGGSK